LDSFPLLAIPLFILAAEIMNNSGATNRIFKLASVSVAHITGGLGHVNILASVLFSGMSGSAVADASGLGMIEIKAMEDDGYDLPFSAAVTAASSTIGPIIPPSVPMVIYGVISGSSIGALFMGGIIPGLVMSIGMMLVVYVVARKRKINVSRPRASFKEWSEAFVKAFPSLFLPVLILGGIWGGIFSPTEAAAVAVVYSAFLGFFIHHELKLFHLKDIFYQAGKTTASIMLIVAAAGLYGWLISTAQIPQLVRNALLGISDNPIVILLIINFILLIMGMFMELIAILTITVPVFLPVANAMGFDPIYFGVVVVLNLMIGFLTPPFGLNIFIMQRISKVSFNAIVRELVPFMVVLLGTLLLMVFFPDLVMFIPNAIYQ
jgi:tripartite ATP-independent transporter DctM subunit